MVVELQRTICLAWTVALFAVAARHVRADERAAFVGPPAPRIEKRAPTPAVDAPFEGLGASPALRAEERSPARPVNLSASMEELVKRKTQRLIEADRRRLAWRNGLFGLGGYRPDGTDGGYGYAVPPRDLFPRGGLGQSLNIDPITGKRY